MTDDDIEPGFSLRRWSRRKLEAARETPVEAAPVTTAPAPMPMPPEGRTQAVPVPAAGSEAPATGEPPALPSIESLGFDSDFTPFLQAKVDEAVRRRALKRLFQDPRFNVMDGLDVYIDDYSVPDPISPEAARQLHHVRSFFAPPKTRVNAQGCVEDVPADEVAAPPAARLPDADATVPATAAPAAGADARLRSADGADSAHAAPNAAAAADALPRVDAAPVARDDGPPKR